jgi:hypothetical protein
MTLTFQTEYALGRRGGRVCRTYHGFQAFVAILIAGALGLVFGLVELAVRMVALVVSTCLTVIFAIPLRLLRRIFRHSRPRRPILKPAGVPFDDLA